MNRFDAIVIGDGVNGLLCASYLASAGRSVALVPRTEKTAPHTRRIGKTVVAKAFPRHPRAISILAPPRLKITISPRLG